MLARSFLTAADLKLSHGEVEALIGVLHMLERGELVDTKRGESTVPNGFCMSTVSDEKDCGTAACLMGWAQFISKSDKVFDVVFCGDRYPQSMYELFMFGDSRRHAVKGEQAARALSNYLTTGDAKWDEVLFAAHAEGRAE